MRFVAVFRRGEPVPLNFWAGSAPCQAEMPSFQGVADDYQGRVLGANRATTYRLLPPFDDHLPLVLCVGAGESTPPGARCRKVVPNG